MSDFKAKMNAVVMKFVEDISSLARDEARESLLEALGLDKEPMIRNLRIKSGAIEVEANKAVKKIRKATKKATKRAAKKEKRSLKERQKDAKRAWRLRNQQATQPLKVLKKSDQLWLENYTKDHPLKVQKVR